MIRELTVGDFMTTCVLTIGAKATLATAHQVMRENRVRHLPVLEGDRLVGIVSQRDLYLLETIRGINAFDTQVEDAMSANPYVVPPTAPLTEVVKKMIAHRWGSALVSDGVHLKGVFTTVDAMRALVSTLPAPTRKTTRRKGAPRAP